MTYDLARVIEPLSPETARLLQPLHIAPPDFLFIDTDAEGRHFTLRVRNLRLRRDDRPLASWETRCFVNGVEYLDTGGMPVTGGLTQWFRNLPESKWNNKKGTWSATTTEFNATMIVSCWPTDKVVYGTQRAESIIQGLVNAMHEGADRAMLAAKFKVNGELSERWKKLGIEWRERPGLELSAYQRTAIDIGLGTTGYALFMDRGTGKTPCAVQRVCLEAQAINAGTLEGGVSKPGSGVKMLRVLIVCPGSVRMNWMREFSRFATVPGRTAVVRGGQAKRIRILTEAITPDRVSQFSALIISYDSFVASSDYFAAVPWDLVISDESHYFKDGSTKRWQAMSKLRDASERRLILTGTPIGNRPTDLWTQLEFLRHGASGFADYKSFKNFHGIWDKQQTSHGGVEKLIGLKNIPLLQERLARISFAVTKAEAGLNLPDKVSSICEIEMLPYQAEVYTKLQDQLALEIEDKFTGATDEITVNNILTMLLRLAQITSGYITYDAKVDADTGTVIYPKREVELCETNPKISALLELLQAEDRDPKAKAVVWCTFVHNIKRVSQALTQAGIKHGCYYGGTTQDERERLYQAFNKDPEFKVLICNAQTAGEGLNLVGYDWEHPDISDTYCDLEVFFSSNWSAIQRAQAEDRAHRRGTRMPVQVVDLVVPGTIDEDIIDRVSKKRQMADVVTDIKNIIDSVLGRAIE